MTSRDRVLFRTLLGRSLTGRIRLHGDTWYLIDCDKPKLPMLVEVSRIVEVIEGVVPLRLPLEDSRGPRRIALDIAVEPAMLPT